MYYSIKKYQKKQTTRKIINNAVYLIKKLSRVGSNKTIIKKIKTLCIAYKGEKTIWIICIKERSEKYINSIIKRCKIQHLPKEEVGYFYVLPKYRNYKVGSALLKRINKKDTFATTTEKNIWVQKIFQKNKFKKTGISFKSKLSKDTYLLFTNLTENKK